VARVLLEGNLSLLIPDNIFQPVGPIVTTVMLWLQSSSDGKNEEYEAAVLHLHCVM
jgi:hypothetical protein